MAVVLSVHVVGPTTFLQFDDASGPYTINTTAITYGSTSFSPASALGVAPYVNFTTAFRVFVDITGLAANQPVGITGGGGPFSSNWLVATAQSVSTPRDTAVGITVGATGGVPPYTFGVSSGPSHGVLTGSAPNYIYTPTTDYVGADSFVFYVDDGIFPRSSATVSITVTPVYRLDSVSPSHGSIAGGTAVTLTGVGMAPAGCTVTFGGANATSVVVAADGESLTCVTPAHAAGYVTVAFVNGDATGDSKPLAYLYTNPATVAGQWMLFRFDLKPRGEQTS